MYESFFGLRERPFDLTPNPRYLFMTPRHREALTTIQYGLSGRKGITLVLGPAGTGKTTLVHAALQQHPDNVRVIYLANPTLEREEFFHFLALECGLSEAARSSKAHTLAELRRWLLHRRATDCATALIIDEVQAMPLALLEEVRLLTNMETPADQLLSIVLVGQADLTDRLNTPGLEQFKQRIALRSRLEPLTADETSACITERIRIAGGDVAAVFTADAVADIHEASKGIPRTVNVICDNALVSGFALDQRPVGRDVIAEVCRDFDLPAPRRERGTHRPEPATDTVLAAAAAYANAATAPARKPEMGQTPQLRPTPAPADAPPRAKGGPVRQSPPDEGEPRRRGLRALFLRTVLR
jgi:general secretion pathway protein A